MNALDKLIHLTRSEASLFNEPERVELSDQSAAELAALKETLSKAIGLIKQWHNIGDGNYRLPEDQQEIMWDIYLNNAPEMKPIREYIASKVQP